MKIALQLVTWNSARHLGPLFESLKVGFQLSAFSCRLLVLDNSSGDDSVEVLKRECPSLSFPFELHESKTNTGFAGGHNRLLAMHDAQYTLIINPDLIFEPDCIEKLVQFLDTHPDAAAVAPRLMRMTPSNLHLIGGGKVGVVDSLGLKVFRNRRVVEIGAGEQWDNETMKQFTEVFGLSGACAMFRTEAIKDVSFADGTFLDESYGSYKEDVDLAFRIQSAGYHSFVLFDAVAYHARGAKGAENQTTFGTIKNKQTQAVHVRYHSYKNHLMTLYKNEYWQNFLLDFPLILWYEIKKFVYLLLFDRMVLKGLGEVWKMRWNLRDKRAWIISKRKVGWREMRMWYDL